MHPLLGAHTGFSYEIYQRYPFGRGGHKRTIHYVNMISTAVRIERFNNMRECAALD